MPRGRGKRSRRPNLRSRVKTLKKRSRSVSKPKAIATRGYVHRLIKSQQESKRLTTEFTKNLFHIGGTTSFRDNNIIALCPNASLGSIYQMVQGVGQQQRVGNAVSPSKIIFRGIMAPNPYNPSSNPTPNPVMIRMYILSTKRNVPGSSVAEIYNICNNTIFANGNASLGMLGTLYDVITPINTDVVTCHFMKTFKLGYENYSGVTGGADTGQTKASNDYKLNQRFSLNLTKYFTKVWKFNDNDGSTTSRQLYAVFQPVNFNGSIPSSATTPAGLIAGIDVFYKDA